MNLLNILDNELKNKHYNNFEKVRYIYLRTCELFSFDARYYFVESFNKKLFNNIIDKKIDITNVDDFLVICHSYSKYVLLRLVNELTTANVSLHSGPHSFVEYKDDDDLLWRLDATYGDLSRAKIGIKTTGFSCLESWNFTYQDDLDMIDESFGYKYKDREDFLKLLDLNSFNSFINGIDGLIKDNELKYFTDVLFFVKWLINGVFCVFSSSTGMDDNYNFGTFIYDETNKDLFYLSKEDDNYGIKKIPFEEGLQLSKRMSMNNKSIFNN